MTGERRSPPRKLLLALEILGVYVRVRWLLRRGDLPTVLGRLRSSRDVAAEPGEAGLGRAVTRTLRCLPTDSRCLMQSLVLTRLLARRGIESSLVIGVAPETPALAAHAWVEREGRPLLSRGGSAFARLTEL